MMKDESRLRHIMHEWEMYKEGGCYLCKYEDRQEWEEPCASCKRSHKDFWERKETK